MLRIMENETKIFVCWLIKLIKKDKKIKAKELARLVGCDASTISGYIRGRTKPDDDIRQAILKATETPYAQMMEIGRRESEPKAPELAGEDINTLIDERFKTLTQQPDNNILMFRSETEREHFKIMQSFIDQETAKTFNEYLAELERLSVSEYELMLSTLKIKVKRLREKGQTDKSLGEEPLTGSRTG